MGVWFVYRSHYHGPTGLYRRRFDDATVLDWFRARWQGRIYDDGANELAEEMLGTHVYGFASLFDRIAERSLAPPRNERQLVQTLREHLYLEGELVASPGLLQMLTDDDEIQLAYYFFDDNYLERHGRRAEYLLREDWQMPPGHGTGGFKPAEKTQRLAKVRGEGTTYLMIHGFWDSGNLDDVVPVSRIDGIRLPQLARYLATNDVDLEGHGDMGLIYGLPPFRAELFPRGKKAKGPADPFLFALRDDPDDDASWQVFGDWLAEHGGPSGGAFLLRRALEGVSRHNRDEYTHWKPSPKKSRIQVEEHIAVYCRHVARWDKHDMYHQWYLFDDLWASAHPDLANALLRYARRWDVLTTR